VKRVAKGLRVNTGAEEMAGGDGGEGKEEEKKKESSFPTSTPLVDVDPTVHSGHSFSYMHDSCKMHVVYAMWSLTDSVFYSTFILLQLKNQGGSSKVKWSPVMSEQMHAVQ
jgi:hypothetical protein